MNAPSEMVQMREVLWSYLQDVAARQEALSALSRAVVELAQGIALPALVALVLLPIILFRYQPRVPRGALWTPAFGIFGGTPKYYSHTRPASFFGFLLKTRHCIATRRRRRS